MNKPFAMDTRLHFSKKDFHRNGWDKHMIGGALFAISGGFAAAGGVFISTGHIPTPEEVAAFAAWTGIVAGAAVELMDYLNNRINHEHHGVEVMDFLFTSLGGALAAGAIYIILSLIG